MDMWPFVVKAKLPSKWGAMVDTVPDGTWKHPYAEKVRAPRVLAPNQIMWHIVHVIDDRGGAKDIERFCVSPTGRALRSIPFSVIWQGRRCLMGTGLRPAEGTGRAFWDTRSIQHLFLTHSPSKRVRRLFGCLLVELPRAVHTFRTLPLWPVPKGGWPALTNMDRWVAAQGWLDDLGTVRIGMWGKRVRVLARRLVELGYLESAGRFFGLTMRRAVKEFQQYNELPVAGSVGKDDWAVLTAL